MEREAGKADATWILPTAVFGGLLSLVLTIAVVVGLIRRRGRQGEDAEGQVAVTLPRQLATQLNLEVTRFVEFTCDRSTSRPMRWRHAVCRSTVNVLLTVALMTLAAFLAAMVDNRDKQRFQDHPLLTEC